MARIIDITNMVKPLKDPPNRIREIRVAQGKSLREVSEALNTSASQISRFEIGERTLDLEWMRRIARVLGVKPGELLRSEDNETSLSERERLVLTAMREGEPYVADAIAKVAESLVPYVAGEEERRRA